MVKISQLLGGEEVTVRKQMQDVFDFEVRLANVSNLILTI